MEVIFVKSEVFNDLKAQINTIAKFVASIQEKARDEPAEGRVDNYEVCTFLKTPYPVFIAQRTTEKNAIDKKQ